MVLAQDEQDVDAIEKARQAKEAAEKAAAEASAATEAAIEAAAQKAAKEAREVGTGATNIPTGATVVITTPIGFKLGPFDYTVSLG